MRFSGLALVATIATLSACGGGGDQASQNATPAASASVVAMPATGKTVELKMVGDEKGYRFEPREVTINVGDAVTFQTVSGPPHNVAFTNVPAESRAQLQANMPEAMGDLMGKMMVGMTDAYTVSFAGVGPGRYEFNCTPHLVNNMTGVITVR